MLFQDKLDRARKLQIEQGHAKQEVTEEYHGEKLYEPSLEESLEKGDMFALIVSTMLTILPVAVFVLFLIIFISWIFFIR